MGLKMHSEHENHPPNLPCTQREESFTIRRAVPADARSPRRTRRIDLRRNLGHLYASRRICGISSTKATRRGLREDAGEPRLRCGSPNATARPSAMRRPARAACRMRTCARRPASETPVPAPVATERRHQPRADGRSDGMAGTRRPRTLWISVVVGETPARNASTRAHGFSFAGEYEFPVGEQRDREIHVRRQPPRRMSESVVLVHGLWMRGITMRWLTTRLQQPRLRAAHLRLLQPAAGHRRGGRAARRCLRERPRTHVVAHSSAACSRCARPSNWMRRARARGLLQLAAGQRSRRRDHRGQVPGRRATGQPQTARCWSQAWTTSAASRSARDRGCAVTGDNSHFDGEHDGTVTVAETRHRASPTTPWCAPATC